MVHHHERKPSVLASTRSSIFSSFGGSNAKDSYLPLSTISEKPKPRLRVRTLLGHCLYRRVLFWAIACMLFIMLLVLRASGRPASGLMNYDNWRLPGTAVENDDSRTSNWSSVIQEEHKTVMEPPRPEQTMPPGKLGEEHRPDPVRPGTAQEEKKPEEASQPQDEKVIEAKPEDRPHEGEPKKEEQKQEPKKEEHKENPKKEDPKTDEKQNGPHWLKYPHLNGYYFGLKSIVPASDHIPEYPKSDDPSPQPVVAAAIVHSTLPTPTPYNPYPDYNSPEHIAKYGEVVECFINETLKTPVPDIFAYNGIPQYQPDPAFGSYDLLGINKEVCFDRFGRYGTYGLGYDYEKGGTGEGMDTEMNGTEEIWKKSGLIDYSEANWATAQNLCYEKNKHRFITPDEVPKSPHKREESEDGNSPKAIKKLTRTAIVIRIYVGFEWTHHSVLNFRAMISELALKTHGEYAVHFLLHVKDNEAPIWADPVTAQKILNDEVPDEFHGLCTLWSEAQMKLWYPHKTWDALSNPSAQDIHGVYRSAHMPLQVFAQQHPEYEHFWNWEMDMRYTGSYYELFESLSRWAEKQPRLLAWERSAKYYIPSIHGDYANFTQIVKSELPSKPLPVFGPVHFAGRRKLRLEEKGESFMPEGCAQGDENIDECGIGEPADIITLNPMFDAEDSGWVFANDVTGYPKDVHPPRRSSIITASRLSRRLLNVMHEEVWRHYHSMFSEMFPASMALHHGLKAIYAPHPVYLDRAWAPQAIEKAFNGGRDGTSGGKGSPFDYKNEHNHKGTSWYYNSEFAGLLWRRWLGYPQKDGRGQDGGKAGEGRLRGGKQEEESPDSSGRMCLRSMLVHPIKFENPEEKD